MNITEKLLKIQTELKAPKNQRNAFGKYNYRSAEDILEAIKPLAAKHKVLFKITEKVEKMKDRVCVVSTAKMIDATDPASSIESDATAFIDFGAKGMQAPQQTGSASSYAKKYALGNLLLIDDTKDSDATNDHSTTSAIPALMKGSTNWSKVVKYLQEGGDLNKVIQKYSVSSTLKKELQNLTN
jgi:hypothetical protein